MPNDSKSEISKDNNSNSDLPKGSNSIWGANSRFTFIGNNPLPSKGNTATEIATVVETSLIPKLDDLISKIEILNARVPKDSNSEAVEWLTKVNQFAEQSIRASQTPKLVASGSDVDESNNNTSFKI